MANWTALGHRLFRSHNHYVAKLQLLSWINGFPACPEIAVTRMLEEQTRLKAAFEEKGGNVCEAIVYKMALADPVELAHLLDFFTSKRGTTPHLDPVEAEPERNSKPMDTFEALRNYLGMALPSEVDPREVARWFYHSSCSSPKISGQKSRWLAAQPVQRLFSAVENASRASLKKIELIPNRAAPMAPSFFSSAFVVAVEYLSASVATTSPDMLSLLPLLQKMLQLLTEHYMQLSREQPAAISALVSFLSSLLASEKAAPEVMSLTLSTLIFLQSSQKSCEALFSTALAALKVTFKRPELDPGASLSTLTDVIKNISFAATRLYPPMRFDAENCLGGFWVQSNEFPHTSTEPRENYAMAIDQAGDYLYILREKQLLKVGTGAGEHITFEGRVYHSAELAQFGRIACLQNKLYLCSSVFANAAEAVIDVYDATSLSRLTPLVVPVPVQGKLVRPVDIVTDGTNLYLVHLIEQSGNDQHVIIVHELVADNLSAVARTFQLKLPPGVRQNAQARFAFNTNGNHFAAVLELPGSAVVQSIFDMQGQHLSSGSQSKLMLLSLTTCYDPYNNLLWNYSPVWHAAIKWTTHPTKAKNPPSVALATADTIIYRQLSLPGAPTDGSFLSIAMKLVAVAESKAVGLQDEWMTPGVARKAARLFEYVCTTAIEKSLEPNAQPVSPVMHFIASACIRSLRLLLRYVAAGSARKRLEPKLTLLLSNPNAPLPLFRDVVSLIRDHLVVVFSPAHYTSLLSKWLAKYSDGQLTDRDAYVLYSLLDILLENGHHFFPQYLNSLSPEAPNVLCDELVAAMEVEDRPHASLLKRMIELAACSTFTARTLDTKRPRTWLFESARKMMQNIDAVRESPSRLRLLTICLCALLHVKTGEVEDNAKLLPLLLSATSRLDEGQSTGNAAASALIHTRTKPVQLSGESLELTWSCDATFATGFMLFFTRVRLPGVWRLKVTGSHSNNLIGPNIHWSTHADGLLLQGDTVTLQLQETPGVASAAPQPANDTPSVFAPAFALPQEPTGFSRKPQAGPIVDAYLVLQCNRTHDAVLLLFELMQRIATNQLASSLPPQPKPVLPVTVVEAPPASPSPAAPASPAPLSAAAFHAPPSPNPNPPASSLAPPSPQLAPASPAPAAAPGVPASLSASAEGVSSAQASTATSEAHAVDSVLSSPLLSNGLERGALSADAEFFENFIDMKEGTAGGACAAHVSDRILSAGQFWSALSPAMAKVERAVIAAMMRHTGATTLARDFGSALLRKDAKATTPYRVSTCCKTTLQQLRTYLVQQKQTLTRHGADEKQPDLSQFQAFLDDIMNRCKLLLRFRYVSLTASSGNNEEPVSEARKSLKRSESNVSARSNAHGPELRATTTITLEPRSRLQELWQTLQKRKALMASSGGSGRHLSVSAMHSPFDPDTVEEYDPKNAVLDFCRASVSTAALQAELERRHEALQTRIDALALLSRLMTVNSAPEAVANLLLSLPAIFRQLQPDAAGHAPVVVSAGLAPITSAELYKLDAALHGLLQRVALFTNAIDARRSPESASLSTRLLVDVWRAVAVRDTDFILSVRVLETLRKRFSVRPGDTKFAEKGESRHRSWRMFGMLVGQALAAGAHSGEGRARLQLAAVKIMFEELAHVSRALYGGEASSERAARNDLRRSELDVVVEGNVSSSPTKASHVLASSSPTQHTRLGNRAIGSAEREKKEISADDAQLERYAFRLLSLLSFTIAAADREPAALAHSIDNAQLLLSFLLFGSPRLQRVAGRLCARNVLPRHVPSMLGKFIVAGEREPLSFVDYIANVIARHTLSTAVLSHKKPEASFVPEGFGATLGGPAVSTGGGFGALRSPGGFGAAPASSGGFGSGFATAAAGSFGAPSSGGFGAPASSGGFGAPVASSGGFGAPASSGGFGAPASSGGGFGAPSSGGGFGGPRPAGGFGSQASAGSFGPSSSSGSFGAPAASSGGFGAPSTGPSFSFASSAGRGAGRGMPAPATTAPPKQAPPTPAQMRMIQQLAPLLTPASAARPWNTGYAADCRVAEMLVLLASLAKEPTWKSDIEQVVQRGLSYAQPVATVLAAPLSEPGLQDLTERVPDLVAALLLLGGHTERLRVGAQVSFSRKDLPSVTSRGVIVQYRVLDSRAEVLVLSAGVPHISRVELDRLELVPCIQPSAILSALGLSLANVVVPICTLIDKLTVRPGVSLVPAISAFTLSLRSMALRALRAVLAAATAAPPAVLSISTHFLQLAASDGSESSPSVEERAASARSMLLQLLAEEPNGVSLPFPTDLTALRRVQQATNIDSLPPISRVRLVSQPGHPNPIAIYVGRKGPEVWLAQFDAERGLTSVAPGRISKANRQFDAHHSLDLDEQMRLTSKTAEVVSVFDAKRLLSLLLQRFNTPLESLYRQCENPDTFIALLGALLSETLPSREKMTALRQQSGVHACTASLPAAQALGERLMELLRVEAADPAKAGTGLGNALLDRFEKKPSFPSDWEFVHWAVTAVCRTDATLAKRHVSVLFLKLIGMLSTVDNHDVMLYILQLIMTLLRDHKVLLRAEFKLNEAWMNQMSGKSVSQFFTLIDGSSANQSRGFGPSSQPSTSSFSFGPSTGGPSQFGFVAAGNTPGAFGRGTTPATASARPAQGFGSFGQPQPAGRGTSTFSFAPASSAASGWGGSSSSFGATPSTFGRFSGPAVASTPASAAAGSFSLGPTSSATTGLSADARLNFSSTPAVPTVGATTTPLLGAPAAAVSVPAPAASSAAAVTSVPVALTPAVSGLASAPAFSSTAPAITPVASASSPATGFSFGGASAALASSAPAFGSVTASSAAATSATVTPTLTFPSFGASTVASAPAASTSASVPAASTPSSAPSFGTTVTAPAFGAPASAPTAASVSALTFPSFGSLPASSGATASAPAAAAVTSFAAVAASAPAFGVSSSTPAFGAPASASSTPAFGAATPSASTFPSFGTAASAPAFGNASSAPAWGSGSASPTPSLGAASTLAFGTVPASTPASFSAASAPVASPFAASGFTFGPSAATAAAGGFMVAPAAPSNQAPPEAFRVILPLRKLIREHSGNTGTESLTCALFAELIDPEDKLAHPTATDMAAPYEWQVSLAKLLRTWERNRLAAESAPASSTQGQWTALADTDLQECIRSALPKGQMLASLDPSQVPAAQPGVFPTLAKFSPEDIMFRFAMLQHLNRVVLNLHDRLELPLARYEWSLLASIRREKSAIFQETKLQLLKSRLGPQPPDVPKIRVARRSASATPTTESTIFFQVFKQLHTVQNVMLHHTSRAFQVEFQGEGASDAGGPYREVLTNMCNELQSKALPLLIPTPNARESVGTNTDQWMPNPSQSSAQALQQYTFLGRLMGIACRTGTPLALDLSPMVWKELAGEKLALTDLALVDARSAELLKRISRGELVGEEDELEMFFVTRLSDGSEVELKPGGASERVVPKNVAEYVALSQQVRLHECSTQVAAIQAGLAQMVPVELLSLFSWRELEELVCGVPDVSVESLKANCQLSGFVRDDPVLESFWAVLNEMTPKERCLFVKFTCGLSRLPTGYNSAQKLKIVAENDSDATLPRASTCFWSFYLPRYSRKEIMRDRIITAITSCGDIDNDFLVQ